MDLTYRMINVFATKDDPFSGNAICVFDDASGTSDDQMQHLAQQVNLETVFMLSHSDDGAEIRIFSPGGEGRFAGSASLGTAHVLCDLLGGTRKDLELKASSETTIVRPEGVDNWVIQAREGQVRRLKSTPQILASLVELPIEAVSAEVMVINSGRSGIVLPVRSVEDVHETHLDARLLHSYAMLLNTEPQLYVWADAGNDTIESRMFFGPQGGVVEVAATGSGAANLGHWMAANGIYGRRRVSQGAAVGRPSFLDLDVHENGDVFVGGHVNQVAQGTFTI